MVKRGKIILVIAILFISTISTYAASNVTAAYEYSYNGQALGIVEEPKYVYEAVEETEKDLSAQIGANIKLDSDNDIKIKTVITNRKTEVEDEKDVVDTLESFEDLKTSGSVIQINGKQEVFLDSQENARLVLEKVRDNYEGLGDNEEEYIQEKYNGASFEEDVQIEEHEVNPEEILTTASALDEIEPLLNVITKRNVSFEEEYGPKIIYDDTDNLYKGQEIETKQGKSGNRTVNADIIERNGKQIERKDRSYTVNEEQVTREVMRGTKEQPAKIGKGFYLMPMEGRKSSGFGERWGKLHKGIDIATPEGTAVLAADAGKVVQAGDFSNGYGKMLTIDHGHGRTTVYAHNSKLLVKPGNLVYRGQQIAESGNTGKSTGPHLHFETQFNGVPKDPDKYL